MKVIDESIQLLDFPSEEIIYDKIERAARVCCQSYQPQKWVKDTRGLIKYLIKAGHHSVIEHINITVVIICDRGISHELVRHRLASYSQESTRYCNYANGGPGEEFIVIKPFYYQEGTQAYETWYTAMEHCELAYLNLIELESSPQEARAVLPNSLKTEIMISANLREWRHILKLRTGKNVHPQMRKIMLQLLAIFKEKCELIFSDIVGE